MKPSIPCENYISPSSAAIPRKHRRVQHNCDPTTMFPPATKRPRRGSDATAVSSNTTPTRFRRALSESNASHSMNYPVRNPQGLLLLSFPLKLHLMLERCESERCCRRRNPKRRSVPCSESGLVSVPDVSSSEEEETNSTDASSDSDHDDSSIIVGWLPSGKSFKIYDEERFVREIMTSYFFGHDDSNGSFETFERNLELWGFSRMPCVEGPTTRRVHVCSHPFFVKGLPSLCRNMRFRIPHRPLTVA